MCDGYQIMVELNKAKEFITLHWLLGLLLFEYFIICIAEKNCLKVSLVVYLYQDVGCDHLIGSGAKEDICGVCKGNGTSCRTVEGRFNQLAGSGTNLLSVFALIFMLT